MYVARTRKWSRNITGLLKIPNCDTVDQFQNLSKKKQSPDLMTLWKLIQYPILSITTRTSCAGAKYLAERILSLGVMRRNNSPKESIMIFWRHSDLPLMTGT